MLTAKSSFVCVLLLGDCCNALNIMESKVGDKIKFKLDINKKICACLVSMENLIVFHQNLLDFALDLC